MNEASVVARGDRNKAALLEPARTLHLKLGHTMDDFVPGGKQISGIEQYDDHEVCLSEN